MFINYTVLIPDKNGVRPAYLYADKESADACARAYNTHGRAGAAVAKVYPPIPAVRDRDVWLLVKNGMAVSVDQKNATSRNPIYANAPINTGTPQFGPYV